MSSRVKQLRRGVLKGDYVLYWMQQSQRAVFNPALEYAIRKANELNQPVLVVFGLSDKYPDANIRHYRFLLEGLQDVSEKLKKRGIRFLCKIGNPPAIAIKYSANASVLVCDRGYLRHQKEWRNKVAERSACPVFQVEGDVIVPVETASGKREYAARTIRKKLWHHIDEYIDTVKEVKPVKTEPATHDEGLDLSDITALLEKLDTDRSVFSVDHFFKGGTSEAEKRFNRFIEQNLKMYLKNRNHPETDDISHMSMYLHFGQVSPVWLLLKIKDEGPQESVEAYLEELLVRRELAVNYVNFSTSYDSYENLPAWAVKTLEKHKYDKREHFYSASQLENSETHDPYWNAAMNEMKYTGFMHNYMRMYWGKKILEWASSPEYAFQLCLHLNNKYFLDGRDCNTYANIGWIFGLHDRPWKERPVYGTVRSMTASGLKRKFNPDDYVKKVRALVLRSRNHVPVN